MFRFGAALLVLVAFCGVAAAVTSQGTMTLGRWRVMDVCAHQAQKAFPDFDAATNAKREAYYQRCHESGNLPPRDPVSPPAPTGSN